MKTIQKNPAERWEDNKERCKEVMSTTIAELTGRTDDQAHNLCNEMAETGIMDFHGVASGMKSNGKVDFENPFIKRVSDFLMGKGFKRGEAHAIVGAICEFAASTLLMEG
ncbi:MAG: hypothetical protein IPJ00_16525 [Saprospirales bacterium]|nr:hypothetical protein [Saprospirales bacterium]